MNQACKSINPPSRIKLSILIEEYLQKNRIRLKWATQYWTRQSWQKLLQSIDDIDVSDFSQNDAEDFIEHLYNQGLSINSVKSYVNAVRTVLNWSWQRGYRNDDPFNGLKLPKSQRFEIHIYNQTEIQTMLATNISDIWRARIMAALTAGLRKSEVLNLIVKDVDFEKGFISIQAKNDTSFTWYWSPKGYKSRRVPLTENFAKILTKIMTELPDNQPYLMLTEKRYWWLQQLRTQGKMPERMMLEPDENFSRPFERIKQEAGIKEGTFHDLRRTCITWWSQCPNLSIREVQKLAGHADIKTTELYYLACRLDITERAKVNPIV